MKSYVFEIFGYIIGSFYYSSVRKFGFFTLFGYGIDWTSKSKPMLFSQRIGITKYYELFGWRFTFFTVKDI